MAVSFTTGGCFSHRSGRLEIELDFERFPVTADCVSSFFSTGTSMWRQFEYYTDINAFGIDTQLRTTHALEPVSMQMCAMGDVVVLDSASLFIVTNPVCLSARKVGRVVAGRDVLERIVRRNTDSFTVGKTGVVRKGELQF